MLKLIKKRTGDSKRKGAILVLAAFFLVGILTFVGMSVDLGLVNVTKTRMQTCADACALAAAQEIVAAIQDASKNPDIEDPHAYAETQAVAMAQSVASKNKFLVTKADVVFGRRSWDVSSQSFEVDWTASPYNAVKVTVRRDDDRTHRKDGKLNLLFGPAFGRKAVSLKTEAAAYVEARDFVTVLDFSGSMNYDSVPFQTSLDKDDVEDNLDDIYDALHASNAYYSDASGTKKFPTGGWGKINSYAGTYKVSSSANTIYDFLELGGEESDEKVKFYDYNNYSKKILELGPGTYNLNNLSGNVDDDINSFKVPSGFSVTLWDFANQGGWKFGPKTSNVSSMGSYNNDAEWVVITGGSSTPYSPYPQEGRSSNGNFKGKPSESESEAMWKDYISWVISNSNDGNSSRLRIDSSHDYRYDFGYRTLMMYMVYEERRNDESEDLWRVPGYPYQAVKDGMSQFNSFLTNLSFGDSLGLVSYATTARKQNKILASDVSAPNSITNVDLGTKFMTTDYDKIETIQTHHQAAHYTESTNIGDGVKNAREILTSEGRAGARWQMLVMTDGKVNKPGSLPSLPSGWDTFDWNALTDWDGDGVANYDQSDINSGQSDQKKYLFYETKVAVENGITVHTMAVGEGADRDLMKALATMGKGLYIEVRGNTTSEEMAQTLREKFNLLAGNVPPAKLLYPAE
ncbi:MAG: pilus assembly protein TadG-related protein [Planctomycetaceae bacterium]